MDTEISSSIHYFTLLTANSTRTDLFYRTQFISLNIGESIPDTIVMSVDKNVREWESMNVVARRSTRSWLRLV
jgi:hypothetical protein